MPKRIILALVLFMLAAVGVSHAQTTPPRLQYTWSPVSTTGALGTVGVDQYLSFAGLNAGVPQYHTIDWEVSGTAPSLCTFRIEGSSDTVHWYGLDVSSPATESCTSSNMIHIPFKPIRAIRVIIVSYTAGDGTTSVVFNYTGAH